jgi:hypothetical protein
MSTSRPPDIDPVMKKLVTLMQEQLPNSARGARAYLLEQLFALEGEALETKADAGTLHSIRSAQNFIRRSDPMMGC